MLLCIFLFSILLNLVSARQTPIDFQEVSISEVLQQDDGSPDNELETIKSKDESAEFVDDESSAPEPFFSKAEPRQESCRCGVRNPDGIQRVRLKNF